MIRADVTPVPTVGCSIDGCEGSIPSALPCSIRGATNKNEVQCYLSILWKNTFKEQRLARASRPTLNKGSSSQTLERCGSHGRKVQ